MLDFFCYLLVDCEEFDKKRKLLKFLVISSTYKNCGINVNQELLYRNLIPENEEQIYEDNYLIRIKSDGPTLIAFVNNE